MDTSNFERLTHPTTKKFWSAIVAFTAFACFLWLFLGYFSAEIYTNMNPSEINSFLQICKQERNTDPKYVKIITLDKIKKIATFDCVYKQSSLNQRIQVTQTNGTWIPSFIQNINGKSTFFWPIYF